MFTCFCYACRQMHQMCGDCQILLARNHLDFEQEVENKVLDPIHNIIEVSHWMVVVIFR